MSQIIEVQKSSDWLLFHQVPKLIYQDYSNYISPLESDVEQVFNPQKNKVFQHGDAQCFVLLDEKEQAIGRIAAFIDHERNESNDFPVGGLGFFECINDSDAAQHLFDKAETYLKNWSVKAIDGPINFGERDRFWGLLVKGDQAPLYQENFQPAYYQQLFAENGYQPYEQILTFHGKMDEVPIERFSQIADRVRKRYGFYTKAMKTQKRIPLFARHFAQVYNVAFKDNPYFKPLEGEQVARIFKVMQPIADFRMIFITYEAKKPVAFAGFIPDINPFLKKMNGRLKWYKLPGLLLKIKTTKSHLLKGIAFGIDPDYQRRGAFAELIDSIYNDYTKKRYSDYYLATIRGHNTVMVKSISNLGVKVERVHLAYRKMLDENLPLNPFEFMEIGT